MLGVFIAEICVVMRDQSSYVSLTKISKEIFFEKKRAHGVLMASAVCEAFNGSTNRITVRDEITSVGKDLLQKTKDIQNSLDIKYVWMGRDGKVLIKRHDGAKVEQISSQKDLESISKASQ